MFNKTCALIIFFVCLAHCAVSAAEFSDNFNRPDGAVGNDWDAWGTCNIYSNELRTYGSPGSAGGVYRSFPLSTPFLCSFVFHTNAPTDGGFDVKINAASGGHSANSQLRFIYPHGAQFQRGYYSDTGTMVWDATQAPTRNFTARAEVEIQVAADLSSHVRVMFNDGLSPDPVDYSFPAPGNPALSPPGAYLSMGNANASSGPHYFDDVFVTDQATPIPTPSPTATPTSIQTVTVTPTLTLTPSASPTISPTLTATITPTWTPTITPSPLPPMIAWHVPFNQEACDYQAYMRTVPAPQNPALPVCIYCAVPNFIQASSVLLHYRINAGGWLTHNLMLTCGTEDNDYWWTACDDDNAWWIPGGQGGDTVYYYLSVSHFAWQTAYLHNETAPTRSTSEAAAQAAPYYFTYPEPTHTPTSTPTEPPTVTPLPTETGVPCAHSGDANGDGAITPADAQLSFLYYLACAEYAPTEDSYCAADFCSESSVEPCDGSVTPADALGILKEYLGYAYPCGKKFATAVMRQEALGRAARSLSQTGANGEPGLRSHHGRGSSESA